MQEIGNYAFFACYKLKEIQLGDSLKRIGVYAFGDCTATHLVIPASVTEIKEQAFRDSALKDILFRGNPPESGTHAFAMNSALVEKVNITYPEENASWAGVNMNHLGGIPDDYSDIEYNFSAHQHIRGTGTVTKNATCAEKDSKHFICTEYEQTKDEPISKIAHNWNSGVITTAAKCTILKKEKKLLTIIYSYIIIHFASSEGHKNA